MPGKPKIIERDLSFPVENMHFEERAGQQVLTGHAVVFGEEAVIAGLFRERFMPGAFQKTITETDQVMLWDHDRSKPLARRSTGTLILREDAKGLYFEATLGKQTWAIDAVESIKRGDVRGVSFGFRTVKDKTRWDRAQEPGKLDLQTIYEAVLREISPTSMPAYEGTNIEIVSRAVIINAIETGQLERDLQDFLATQEPETHHSEQGRSEPDGVHSGAGLRTKILRHKHREIALKLR